MFLWYRIQKDFVYPEKLQTTLRDGTLGDLKRALEMVAILEAQLKEMNPNLDSISEYAPVYIYMQTLSSLALVFALHHYKPTPLYVMDEIDVALGMFSAFYIGLLRAVRSLNYSTQTLVVPFAQLSSLLIFYFPGLFSLSNHLIDVAPNSVISLFSLIFLPSTSDPLLLSSYL